MTAPESLEGLRQRLLRHGGMWLTTQDVADLLEPFLDPERGQRPVTDHERDQGQRPPLVNYMTTASKHERAAAYLETYAARILDGTEVSWEIPNTRASVLKDIAAQLRDQGQRLLDVQDAETERLRLLKLLVDRAERISELEVWRADQLSALIAMAAEFAGTGYKGDGILDGIKFLKSRISELEASLKTAYHDRDVWAERANDIEVKYRMVLWLGHGHSGLYGDDGEMQCATCYMKYRTGDYKRDPLEPLERAVHAEQAERLKKAMEDFKP